MESTPHLRPSGEISLTELPLLQEGRISRLSARPESGGQDLPERLAELGFLPGERVRVLARALFGDPIAVRTGSGTFALRRFEAACVGVELIEECRGNPA